MRTIVFGSFGIADASKLMTNVQSLVVDKDDQKLVSTAARIVLDTIGAKDNVQGSGEKLINKKAKSMSKVAMAYLRIRSALERRIIRLERAIARARAKMSDRQAKKDRKVAQLQNEIDKTKEVMNFFGRN